VQNEVKHQKLKNVSIKDVVVLLDREQGAEKEAKNNSINLHSIINFKTSGVDWLREKISKIEYKVISEYLTSPEKFQNKDIQLELLKSSLKEDTTL
jgi:orotate phosphoribosyltransferase